MPLFDLECTVCSQRRNNVVLASGAPTPTCGSCDGATQKVWDKPPAMYPFKAGMYEHLDKDPVYIGSKQQLKDECRKRGLRSEYAWD